MRTSTTGISDTPTEILDRILDYLHDDREALLEASLVSRKWVYTPRHHLFNRTIITEMWGWTGILIKENARGFIALSQSEHCTILPAIRCIVFLLGDWELIAKLVKVLELLETLPQLIYIPFARSDSIPWNDHALPQIHDFSFDASCMGPGDDAWRLVSSVPSLRTLGVYSDIYSTISFPSNISYSSFRNIRTLRLRLFASEPLFKRLTTLDGSHFSLETFDLRLLRACHSGWSSVTMLNSFLKENSEPLEHLSLGIDYDTGSSAEALAEGSRIDLRPLINLRSLFLRTHDMSAICDSLESIDPSSVLEHLTVHALRWPPDRYKEHKRCDCEFSRRLARFASIMERRQFSGIKKLHFTVPEEVELDAVAEQLAGWKQRGILTLAHSKDEDFMRNSLDFIRPNDWPGKSR